MMAPNDSDSGSEFGGGSKGDVGSNQIISIHVEILTDPTGTLSQMTPTTISENGTKLQVQRL